MKEQVDKAVEIMKQGGIILYPTDTVWGLGCDATNEKAVEKIYKLKQSDNKHSMLVLVYPMENVSLYVRRMPQIAWQLLEVADKPLTLILPNGAGVANNIIPEEGTLGIRVPQHEFCQNMLRALRKPIISTSANIAHKTAPTTLEEVSKEIIDGVDFIVDPRFDRGATRKPSSIISVGANGEIKIIRE